MFHEFGLDLVSVGVRLDGGDIVHSEGGHMPESFVFGQRTFPVVRGNIIELLVPEDGTNLERFARQVCETRPSARPPIQVDKAFAAIERGEDPATVLSTWYTQQPRDSWSLVRQPLADGQEKIQIRSLQHGSYLFIAAEATVDTQRGMLCRWSFEERLGTPLALAWLVKEVRSSIAAAAVNQPGAIPGNLPPVPEEFQRVQAA